MPSPRVRWRCRAPNPRVALAPLLAQASNRAALTTRPCRRAHPPRTHAPAVIVRESPPTTMRRRHARSCGRTNPQPDFRIEGRIFDNYAPKTSNPRNIWTVINDTKVNPAAKSMQADRIVLNLRDSGVDLSALLRQFRDWPMPNLREVLVVTREGTIISLWP